MRSGQGHEFTGTVEEIGSAVKDFKKGDQVVSPFTISWSAALEVLLLRLLAEIISGECFYCKQGFSSRCVQCKLYGTAALDGAQAEFVRLGRRSESFQLTLGRFGCRWPIRQL